MSYWGEIDSSLCPNDKQTPGEWQQKIGDGSIFLNAAARSN